MQIVIDIPEEEYQTYINHTEAILDSSIPLVHQDLLMAVINGTPLPKGHGRLVDVSKIDKDRIDHDNPIIYLTVNGEYIEAISLDYIESLPTIIEADGGDAE